MKRHRVVITGMGIWTSVGPDLPSCWAALKAGRKGIQPIQFWDPSGYQTKVVGAVSGLPDHLEDSGFPLGSTRRTARMYRRVVDEAVMAAGLDACPIPPAQIGQAVGLSVNYTDLGYTSAFFRHRCGEDGPVDLSRLVESGETTRGRFYRRFGDTAPAATARRWKFGGPSLTFDTACAASAHAIGEAFRKIRRGEVRAMVAGGSAALVSPLAILSFSLLGALSRSSDPETASRPFDRSRDGFVMGEGAGAVVLESLESARERGATILAELAGYGSNLTAMTMTDPSPGGSIESEAIRLALRDAGMATEEVDLILAHGTSTPKNDATETLAIKGALGTHARRVMVSSNKGQLGHTISAAGVCNLIFAVMAMKTSVVPPTVNLENPDPACDLDYVPKVSRSAPIHSALVHAFAFGGQNAVLAVRAFDS